MGNGPVQPQRQTGWVREAAANQPRNRFVHIGGHNAPAGVSSV